MTHSLPGHPAGAAGTALALLRVAAALMLAGTWFYVHANGFNSWFAIFLDLPAMLLFLGLGTRITALICVIILVGIGLDVGGWGGAIIGVEALNIAAIALLGAGAYSIDARLFGRRVIRLDC